MSQDPIEYFTHTWHTGLDTYERIVPEDVVRSATVVAAAVHHLAMRDGMLPRFSKDQMPAAVPDTETPAVTPAPTTPTAAPTAGQPATGAARPTRP